MTRIPFVDPDHPDPMVQELLAWVTEAEGRVPNHFLIELHFPENFKTWLTWVRALWGEGELSFEEVQHVGIAVSKANRAPYCAGSFSSVLEHGGKVDAQSVETYLRHDVATLDVRERRIVEFALKANGTPHAVTQDDIAGLRETGLTERGILQIVWLVNMYASSNRITTVFDVDFDDENSYQRLAETLLSSAPGSDVPVTPQPPPPDGEQPDAVVESRS